MRRTLPLALSFAAALGLAGAVGVLGLRLLVHGPERALDPFPAAATAPALEPLQARRRPASAPPAGLAAPDPDRRDGAPGWLETNRAAIEALEAGDFEAAVAGFEACLQALPEEPVLRGNLAEALVRKAVADHAVLRPCEGCPALLARAIELAPERTDLGPLLDRWEREAAAETDFWRESSLHFDLAYDGSRDEILWGSHRILELLEEGYTDFGEWFGRYPVEEGQPRIAVSLYRRESFDRLTGLGDWAGGAFDGSVRVPVDDFELEEARLRRVLRHELVHAFVRAVGGLHVPGWLNEGLAQWLEEGRAAQLASARAELAGSELFPLERLEGSLAAWDDAAQISLAYAQSLLLTDHLAEHYGERVLLQLVAGCAAGDAPAATFRRVTADELDLVLGDLGAELAR